MGEGIFAEFVSRYFLTISNDPPASIQWRSFARTASRSFLASELRTYGTAFSYTRASSPGRNSVFPKLCDMRSATREMPGLFKRNDSPSWAVNRTPRIQDASIFANSSATGHTNGFSSEAALPYAASPSPSGGSPSEKFLKENSSDQPRLTERP